MQGERCIGRLGGIGVLAAHVGGQRRREGLHRGRGRLVGVGGRGRLRRALRGEGGAHDRAARRHAGYCCPGAGCCERGHGARGRAASASWQLLSAVSKKGSEMR